MSIRKAGLPNAAIKARSHALRPQDKQDGQNGAALVKARAALDTLKTGKVTLGRATRLEKNFDALGPQDQQAIKADLQQMLDKVTGDPSAVGMLVKMAGGDPAAHRAALGNRGNTDTKTDQEVVAAGLEKSTKTQDVPPEQQAQNAKFMQQEILSGRSGAAASKHEFTPQAQLANMLKDEMTAGAKAYVAENHPKVAAAGHAVEPAVNQMVKSTLLQLAMDPQAVKSVGEAAKLLTETGGAAALAAQMGGAFGKASGLKAVNPEAFLQLHRALPVGSKGAKAIANVAAKVGVDLGKGAKVAGAAGKTVPFLGNALAVGSTLLGASKLVKQLFKKPFSPKMIAKEGLNTLLQSVGIAFPMVGLAGDLVDLGIGASMKMGDVQKQNPDLAKNPEMQAAVGQAAKDEKTVGLADASAVISAPATLLQEALAGAGQGKAADAVGQLVASSKAAEAKGTGKEMGAAELTALYETSKVISGQMGRVAAATEDTTQKDALNGLASCFGQLVGVLRSHQKADPADAKKNGDIRTKLVDILNQASGPGAIIAAEQLKARHAEGGATAEPGSPQSGSAQQGQAADAGLSPAEEDLLRRQAAGEA